MGWLEAAVAVMALSAGGQTELIDFYADWCGPCHMMDPVVQRMAAQGYPVRRVNIDQDRALAAKYHVQSIPCFVMLVDGREVDRVTGVTSAERLIQMVRAATPAATSAPAASIAASSTPPAPMSLPPRESEPAFSTRAPTVLTPVSMPPAGNASRTRPADDPAFSGAAAKSDAELLAVCVRLKVEENDGRSCGSGTIIDARQGEALILTCAHLFRDNQGKGRIEVDLFGSNAVQGVPGRLVSYDLQRDVALVAIRAPGPVAIAPVAPASHQPRVGDPIVSVGCSNGEDPTVRRTRVTALGKYMGPPNLQIADVPVIGRSGGGLFTPDGMVVGVCNAADPTDKEGFYAAAESIWAELDRAGLSFLYRPAGPAAAPETALAVELPNLPKQMPRPTNVIQPTAKGMDSGNEEVMRLTNGDRAMLEEIQRRLAEGSEVICIVRPHGNSQSRSEIFMLDRNAPPGSDQGPPTAPATAAPAAPPRN